MATFDRQQVVAIILLLAFVELGTALHCYSCNSGPDAICDDTFSYHARTTVAVTSCEHSPPLPIPGAGPNTHCGKSKNENKRIFSNTNNDYVFRGCVPDNYCRLVKSEVSECDICETDRCNSSVYLVPSCITVVLTLLAVKFNL